MAHLRKRLIEELISHDLKWSPCIGIMGMRQTGKTTLAQSFGRHYLTFDDGSLAARLERQGEGLLSNGPFPIVLDEVQKWPPIFDYLKLLIDRKKVPGRYIVTGSVRFASRKPIRESLTGRMVLIDLFPMTPAECHSRPSSGTVQLMTDFDGETLLTRLKKRKWLSEGETQHYLETGGLPGICFRRDPMVRKRLFDQHLDTLLGRDLHLVSATTLRQEQLRMLLQILASQQGQSTNFASIAREVGTSAPTAKKAINSLESLFLIRPHGNTYFVEDQGLANFATEGRYRSTRSPLLGLIYHELRTQLGLAPKLELKLAAFETRGGAHVPFVLTSTNAKKAITIGITIDTGNTVTEKSLKGLEVIKKK